MAALMSAAPLSVYNEEEPFLIANVMTQTNLAK